MEQEFKVLVVCTGNIHRSALGATLLTRWAGWYLPVDVAEHVHVSSAGFAAPAGAPMGARAQRIAQALGADGSTHRATLISDAMLQEADLVLVATRNHLESAIRRVPSALRKTFTIREAGRAAEALSSGVFHTTEDLRAVVARLADGRGSTGAPSADDIVDPEGQDDTAYGQMIREEVPPLAELAHFLLGMPRADVDAYLDAAADPSRLMEASLATKTSHE